MTRRQVKKFFHGWWRRFLAFLIPLLLLPLLINSTQAGKCAYIIIVAVSYWIIEPVGVPATALIPIFCFPLFGIMNMTDTCQHFIKEPVVMYMGCFAVGVAMENSGLHRRVALKVLLTIGTSIRRLTFGCFMLTMLVSNWLNNAASAMLMVPIIEIILQELHFDVDQKDTAATKSSATEKKMKKFDVVVTIDKSHESIALQISDQQDSGSTWRVVHAARRKAARLKKNRIREAILLSITYGASFGGIATLNGSGPNYVFKSLMDEMYPYHEEPTYTTWMICHIPAMLLCSLCACLFLQIVYLGLGFLKEEELMIEHVVKTSLTKKYMQLGCFQFKEGGVLFLSMLLFFTWFFRDPKFMEGWAKEIFAGVKLDDATPAIGVTLLLFLLPSQPRAFWSSPALLSWQTFQQKMPWGILLLVGSSFIIAEGSKRSGFSLWVSDCIVSIGHLPNGPMVFLVVLMTAFLTEFLNNAASASMVLPVLAQLAEARRVNPLTFLVPATVASSFAFMFPVSQPSNAIVFQRGKLTTPQMMVPGLIMNVLSCCIEVFIISTLGVSIFDLNTYPHWAERDPSFWNGTTDYYLPVNESHYQDLLAL